MCEMMHKIGEFLEWLSCYQPLKKDCAVWSYYRSLKVFLRWGVIMCKTVLLVRGLNYTITNYVSEPGFCFRLQVKRGEKKINNLSVGPLVELASYLVQPWGYLHQGAQQLCRSYVFLRLDQPGDPTDMQVLFREASPTREPYRYAGPVSEASSTRGPYRYAGPLYFWD
jgi:hypothetical protein